MATLRNKRKLAAVSIETPEGSRSSRAQNVLDPELTQGYISQVSEEMEGRVTKKFSKELSRTESRILGALSKLDELFLNPQVRTCSVAVQGTSRNNNSGNRETTGNRSSDYPYPEVGYFSNHSGHLNSPEAENDPHSSKFKRITNLNLRIFLKNCFGIGKVLWRRHACPISKCGFMCCPMAWGCQQQSSYNFFSLSRRGDSVFQSKAGLW